MTPLKEINGNSALNSDGEFYKTWDINGRVLTGTVPPAGARVVHFYSDGSDTLYFDILLSDQPDARTHAQVKRGQTISLYHHLYDTSGNTTLSVKYYCGPTRPPAQEVNPPTQYQCSVSADGVRSNEFRFSSQKPISTTYYWDISLQDGQIMVQRSPHLFDQSPEPFQGTYSVPLSNANVHLMCSSQISNYLSCTFTAPRTNWYSTPVSGTFFNGQSFSLRGDFQQRSYALDCKATVRPNGIFPVAGRWWGEGYRETFRDKRPAIALQFGDEWGGASFYNPVGMVLDPDNNLYFIQHTNVAYKISASDGNLSTIAGRPDIFDFSGDGGPATGAGLGTATAIARDHSGNLYIADWSHGRVRKISPQGIITTVAGGGESLENSGSALEASVWPTDVAVDGVGNLFMIDAGNQLIRRVDRSGIITTLAGTPGDPTEGAYAYAIAVDLSGNLFISYPFLHKIYKVAAGTSTPVLFAGGGTGGDFAQAIETELQYPAGLAVDKAGRVLIADYYHGRVRRVDLTGIISTVAGNSQGLDEGDGADPLRAKMLPLTLTLDSLDRLYLYDYYLGKIRVVVPSRPAIVSISGSTALPIQTCQPYTIQVRDHQGNAAEVGADLSITLSGTGDGVFFSDLTCSTRISSTKIARGTNTRVIGYKKPTAGLATLQARGGGLSSAPWSLAGVP